MNTVRRNFTKYENVVNLWFKLILRIDELIKKYSKLITCIVINV